MRVRLLLFAIFSLSGVAAAEVASVMPPTCTRRETLDPAEYQRLGRFVALGGPYRQWSEKNCYPIRLDDPALAKVDRPVGYVTTIAGHDVFIVDLGPSWFTRCTKTQTPVSGSVAVDGATELALHQHLATLPEIASLDLREIGFAEARMRDKGALFALYLATGDRAADVECFEDLDGAVTRAAEELRRRAAP
jgi:hypothetical protein